jgi:hypothetical protein
LESENDVHLPGIAVQPRFESGNGSRQNQWKRDFGDTGGNDNEPSNAAPHVAAVQMVWTRHPSWSSAAEPGKPPRTG